MKETGMKKRNSAEAVKAWRHRTKERIVEAFGGSCGICGYNKCNSSLVLHHLDPSEKDFNFGKIRANIISWARIVNELRKCVMLCSNCHNEVHAGMTPIPKKIQRFDESFAEYRKSKILDECPVCGVQKETYMITCSRECAAKRAYIVDWENFDLKYHLIDLKMSYEKIGDLLNISSGAVFKRARKLGLRSVHTVGGEMNNCPVCGAEKSVKRSTCSKECATKYTERVDWDSFDLRHHLIDLKMSYVKVARLLGVSDKTVRERARKAKLYSVYQKTH